VFSAVKRSFKAFLVALVTVIFLAFAVSNREVVNLSLFPFPYAADLPVFLLTIASFAFGVIIGGITISFKHAKTRREAKAEHKRIDALENEINALKSERPPRPPAAIAHTS
jgi:uncharacterized integral membrane protein